jgi:acyl-ACP thioesterase
MNELDIKHNINVDISMYNSQGNFTISAYQRMIMGMIEEHLDYLNLGEKCLMDNHGISWVLLSTSIELSRKIKPTEKIIGKTWHAGGRIPSFRRDFTFCDESGNNLAIGATVSTLFENESRKICLNKDKIAVVDLKPMEPILENLERRMKITGMQELIEVRKVRPSMTDGVGHVNNTRYGDFVYDAMTEEERVRLGDLKRIDVWFNYELLEGDEFEITKNCENDNVICFSGKKIGNIKSSFDMKLTFFN